MNVRYNEGYDSYDYERRYDRRRHAFRDYGDDRAEDGVASRILLIVLAILIPPLAAFLVTGFRGHFWLNLLLTILFYLPAQVHAVWLVMDRR